MEAQDFYDNELSNYNLLNKIDPATAKQAMQMMEEYHQAKLKLLGIPVVSKSFAVGVEVEITDCIKGHEFYIGEKVTIVEYDDNMWVCRNKKGIEWYINEDEANVC